ncbi:MAG: peptidylprolyl isomerase [Kiritimatiellae bacterium]|nr:peptidylprolyl isomerase [Kiritimatiellia bacterium]
MRSILYRLWLWGWVAGLGSAAAFAESIPLDGFAATVNDRVITIGEVFAEASRMDRLALEEAVDRTEQELRLRENYRQALKRLLEQALLIEEVQRRQEAKPEFVFPETLVENQIQSTIHEQFDDRRDLFIQALAEDGMTLDDFRIRIRDRIGVSQLMRDEVYSRMLLPLSRVREEYARRRTQYTQPEEVRVRVIMLQRGATESETEIKREQAHRAHQRLVGGESFESVARAVSQGYGADAGGDMGWRKPGELNAQIRDALKGMDMGQFSDVLESPDGFHIVQLAGRREESIRTFESVRDELEKELKEQEEDRLRRELITRLRVRHFVRVLAPERPENP